MEIAANLFIAGADRTHHDSLFEVINRQLGESCLYYFSYDTAINAQPSRESQSSNARLLARRTATTQSKLSLLISPHGRRFRKARSERFSSRVRQEDLAFPDNILYKRTPNGLSALQPLNS